MHQRSRKILVFLIVIFMATEIAVVVINGMAQKNAQTLYDVAGKLRL
jgi:hypothetical protein